MSLATVDAEGRPSQRIVLLKGYSEEGFVFFTNLQSRKASEMAANDRVSLHFLWSLLDRQVSISGRVEKLQEAENIAYFN